MGWTLHRSTRELLWLILVLCGVLIENPDDVKLTSLRNLRNPRWPPRWLPRNENCDFLQEIFILDPINVLYTNTNMYIKYLILMFSYRYHVTICDVIDPPLPKINYLTISSMSMMVTTRIWCLLLGFEGLWISWKHFEWHKKSRYDNGGHFE